MRVVCAWCGTVIQAGSNGTNGTSHGMCAECQHAFISGGGIGVKALTNQASYPILVIGGDGRVIHANPAASAVLKHAPKIEGAFPGVVLTCERASDGVCGQSASCEACRLRSALTATKQDGQYRHGQVKEQPKALGGAELQFSTFRVGDAVILVLENRSPGLPPQL